MQTITLYKYARSGGGVDVSPIKPETGEYETMYRLIVDDGNVLVNNSGDECTCIDTENPEEWQEILPDSEAFQIIMGGTQ